MKNLIVLIIFTLSFQGAFSQSFWAKKQAGGNVDETLDIASDGLGNSYSTGYFSSSAQINETTYSVQGLTDIFVTKVSSNGVNLWSESFGGSQSDRGLGVAVDGVGNVLVCGFYTGSINFGNGVSLTSNGGQDAFVLKLDANGNAIWARTGGSSGNSDRANAVAVDGSGNVIITGQFSGAADFGAFTLDATDGTNDAFILKYDSNGNEQWAKQGTGEALDRGLGITTDNSGAVYATGQFSGDISFDNSYSNTIQNAIFLIKYSSAGNEEWFRWGGGSEESISYDIASDGNSVFLTGDFGTTLNFFGTGSTVTLTSGFSSSVFLLSISGSGGFSWGEAAGSNSNVSSRGIDFSSGNIAIAGWFECTFDSYSDEYGEAAFNSLGSKDAFAAIYSSSGSFQWARNFGAGSDEQCNSITLLPDGFVVVAGSNGGSGLIVPVTNAPVNGMSDLIDNENSGINYCGDSNYGNYRSLEGSGGLDGFVLKAIDPSRRPMDFYQRSGGGCDLTIPDACIYLNSSPSVPEPCPESTIACPPYAITASNYSLTGITFAENYQWSFSGSTGVVSLVTSAASESVTITSQDGCYSVSADIEVDVYPEPVLPLITDSEGVNNSASLTTPVFVCPGETVVISAEFPDDYSFQWSGGQFGANPVFTEEISVTEEGAYFISVTTPDGCSTFNVISVIFYDIPVDTPPLIAFPLSNDTIQLCDGGSFPVNLLDSLTADPYPTQQYQITWSVTPGTIIGTSGSATVTPEEAGWYVVTVELISQENPCTDEILTQFTSDSIYVEVVPVPEASIEIMGPEFFCPGDTLVFFLEYDGLLTFEDFEPVENFGDSIYVAAPGFYQITATATNEFGCSDLATDFILVQEVQTPEIFTNPEEAVVCPGDSVQIITTSPGSITWQGPSGTFEGQSDIYVQEPGLYFAEVEFYEGCGLVSNTIEVSEFATPFLDGSNAVLCPGGEVDISIVSSSLDAIEWQAPFSGSDTVQTVTEPGIYSVIVTGCDVEIELFIEVELTEYSVDIEVIDPEPTCDGDSILIAATPGLETYQWFPEGSEEEEWFTENGTVFVVGIDEYGCELASNQIEINFEEVPPLPTFDFTPVCEGEPFTIEVNSNLQINFLESADGEIISNESTVFISEFLSDTTFYVYLNTELCDGPIDSITVGPKPFPEEPIIATDAPVCTGESLSLEVLNAAGGVDYVWLTPTGDVLQGDIVSYSISALDQEGEYLAYANLEDCISDTAGIDVSLFETRQVNLPPDTSLCYRPDFIVAPDTLFDSYQWSDGTNDSIYNPELESSLMVSLVATDFNGCRSVDIIIIQFADCTIQIPNVITPNGDGLNDEWIIGLDQPLFFEVVVYNRWGRIVYESKDFTTYWDGTNDKSGELCSEGVYFYIIRVNDFEGRAFEQQGNLTLFRD
ncbi:gliding motility-associated C-terminal domain-containing protein [Cryomorphaceae bacterium 1068]|nr:gliding motility-associated C-terminal domain-containing protein [Cryomorphaceae bacterium 1068]